MKSFKKNNKKELILLIKVNLSDDYHSVNFEFRTQRYREKYHLKI